MIRPANQAGPAFTRFKINVPAKFRRNNNIVSKGLNRLTQNSFDLVRAVGLGCIKKGHAILIGCSDDIMHLGAARNECLIGSAHILYA